MNEIKHNTAVQKIINKTNKKRNKKILNDVINDFSTNAKIFFKKANANKKYTIFVSSTCIDLDDTRIKIFNAILEDNNIPIGMEFFNSSSKNKIHVMEKLIQQSDYHIVILANRYGSLHTDGRSLTEVEYDYAKIMQVPSYGFIVNDNNWPANKSDKNVDDIEKLNQFKEKLNKDKIVRRWDNADHLCSLIKSAINQGKKEDPRPGWIRWDFPKLINEYTRNQYKIEEMEGTL